MFSMHIPSRESVEKYLQQVFGAEVRVKSFGVLGSSSSGELKAYGYGVPYVAKFVDRGLEKEAVISTMKIDNGFGHDYRADRADNLILAYDTWNKLPKHTQVYDIGVFRKDEMLSMGQFEELFLLTEKVEGKVYAHDLDVIYERNSLKQLDMDRAKVLSDYLVEIHSVKKSAPEIYIRKIRDTLGHGECIFGLADSYPDVSFLKDGCLEELEKKCVAHRWKLRRRVGRLSAVHGDYHPWNILFRGGTDFTALDRSRGEYGEPADDLAGMSINYIFHSLRKHGRVTGPFEELFKIFIENYLAETGDEEVLEALPLFYTFRCLVLASPIWYPTLSVETRIKIFDLANNMLDEGKVDPKRINSYLI